MTSSPKHWRLHLGVHKTATTHIQATFEALQPQLQASGIDYVNYRTISSLNIPDLRLRNPRAWVGGAVLRKQLMARLSPHLSGAETVLMSSEDWVGASEEGLGTLTYRKLSRRIGALISAIPKECSIELFLGVRGWHDYIPSAYATALRFGVNEYTPEELRESIIRNTPDWGNLVDRIQTVAPRAKLTIWPFERYRENAPQIISAIAGKNFETLPKIADPVQTRTPSQRAIEEIRSLAEDIRTPAGQSKVEAIWNSSRPDIEGKFGIFSPTDREELGAIYARQLQAIAARPDVTYLGS